MKRPKAKKLSNRERIVRIARSMKPLAESTRLNPRVFMRKVIRYMEGCLINERRSEAAMKRWESYWRGYISQILADRKKALAKARKCRVCGCTDDDCRQCVAKTGEPCHWVEFDLCSACQEKK